MRVNRIIDTFRKREDGVALVEFALFLPLFLLAFFVVVEFSRVFFSYQGAIAGVRDATRYMARTTDAAICDSAALSDGEEIYTQQTTTAGYYYQIVTRNMDTEFDDVLPRRVVLNSITPRVYCVDETVEGEYRTPTVPMAEIEARFTISFFFGGILVFNGQPLIPPIVHDVLDQSRIYGV